MNLTSHLASLIARLPKVHCAWLFGPKLDAHLMDPEHEAEALLYLGRFFFVLLWLGFVALIALNHYAHHH